MNLSAQLKRLTPTLSGKERALLASRAFVEGRELDPAFLEGMTPRQCEEYNRYIGLLYTCNSTLGVLLTSLTWMVDVLESELFQHSVLAGMAKQVADALEETPVPEQLTKWRSRPHLSLPEFLCGIELEMKATALRRLLVLWQELRALEILWQEIAEQFDGYDLRGPDTIAEAAETRANLRRLLEAASPKRAKKLPEPSAEVLSKIRSHLDAAMTMISYRQS